MSREGGCPKGNWQCNDPQCLIVFGDCFLHLFKPTWLPWPRGWHFPCQTMELDIYKQNRVVSERSDIMFRISTGPVKETDICQIKEHTVEEAGKILL